MANFNVASFISIGFILFLKANGIAANNNSIEYSYESFNDAAGDYCKLEQYYNVVELAEETLRICVQNKPTFMVNEKARYGVEIQLVETIARELNMKVIYQFYEEQMETCSERYTHIFVRTKCLNIRKIFSSF